MNTQVAMRQGQDPINLTDIVLDRQETIKKELIGALNEHIVGQTEAKNALVTTLLDGLFNIYREQGVLGAVFLGGPTGVGKTELARSLAHILLGNPNAFTKIPCENMPNPGDMGRLIGSTVGYVGYGDIPLMADKRIHAGYLEAKKKNMLHPLIQGREAINFSIVLVDEVEKAHPDIPNAFLNALQSGEMEMSSGKENTKSPHSKDIEHTQVTDLKNTLFIFTSNIGEHSIKKGKKSGIGFNNHIKDTSGDMAIFEEELTKHLAPEFIGRMDAVVRCHSLTDEQIRNILALHVDKMNRILAQKGCFSAMQITTTQQFVDHILSQKKETEYGARAISWIIKNIGSQVGFAFQSGKIDKDTKGIIEFGMDHGNPSIQFLQGSSIVDKGMQETLQYDKTDIQEQIKTLVEGKINIHRGYVCATVQEYLKLIAGYDTGFQDICRILEKRLGEYGFSTEDIHALQATAFLSIYESIDQPESHETIDCGIGLFEPVGFRPIEKYLCTAITSKFTLENIYRCIRVLLKRPMTRNEAIVASQHIHRMLQQKKI